MWLQRLVNQVLGMLGVIEGDPASSVHWIHHKHRAPKKPGRCKIMSVGWVCAAGGFSLRCKEVPWKMC